VGEGILEANDSLPPRIPGGCPIAFLPASNRHLHTKVFDIWPTTPVGGERPGVSANVGGSKKRELGQNISCKQITYLFLSLGASNGMRGMS